MECNISLENCLLEILDDTLLNEDQKNRFISKALLDTKNSKWSAFYNTINKHLFDCTSIDKKVEIVIQLLFISTNMIDDLLDEDNGVSGLNQQQAYITSYSITMYLLNLIEKRKKTRIIELLLTSSIGEHKDINFTYDNHQFINEDEYFEMIFKKSGALIEILGVLMCDDSIIHQFMRIIGASHQISNDIEDVLNQKKSDFSQKKMYLPLIKYIEYSGDIHLTKFTRENIIDSGALDYSKLIYVHFMEKGFNLLLDHYPEKQLQIGKLKHELTFKS